jgi:Glycosyl transferase family 41
VRDTEAQAELAFQQGFALHRQGRLDQARMPAKGNLRKEAQKRGIEADRLVFGEKLPPPEYLARYRAADLFLDTLPYNAGTTASDALWVGLPVLTCVGEAFAGRSRFASAISAYRVHPRRRVPQSRWLTVVSRAMHQLMDAPLFADFSRGGKRPGCRPALSGLP